MERTVKSSKAIQPEYLPPTESAAWQHSLRVFLQVTYWKTLDDTHIDPTKWGWRVKDNRLEPVMTDKVRKHLF